MRILWIESHRLIGDSVRTLLEVLMPEVSMDKAASVQSARLLVRAFSYSLTLMDGEGDATASGAVRDYRRLIGYTPPMVLLFDEEASPIARYGVTHEAGRPIVDSATPATLVETIRAGVAGLGAHADASVARAGERGLSAATFGQSTSGAWPPSRGVATGCHGVLDGLAKGLSNREMATVLGVDQPLIDRQVQGYVNEVGRRVQTAPPGGA